MEEDYNPYGYEQEQTYEATTYDEPTQIDTYQHQETF